MRHFRVCCFKPGRGQLIYSLCFLCFLFMHLVPANVTTDDMVARRYTRGVYLRFPISRMTDGRPYDFINLAFKAELLLAGYAVISMDFRGTGKSLANARSTRMRCGIMQDQATCGCHDQYTQLTKHC